MKLGVNASESAKLVPSVLDSADRALKRAVAVTVTSLESILRLAVVEYLVSALVAVWATVAVPGDWPLSVMVCGVCQSAVVKVSVVGETVAALAPLVAATVTVAVGSESSTTV